MSNLLIYIGENRKFDRDQAERMIKSIPGVQNARSGKFIGAVFECNYSFEGRTTIVRLSESLETITVEGLGNESLDFALKLQNEMTVPLNAIDMEYSFNIALKDFKTIEALMGIIQSPRSSD